MNSQPQTIGGVGGISTTNFPYEVLREGEQEVRIVTIMPESAGQEIRCSLATVSLKKRQHFEALSYVWGSDETKGDFGITLDGHPFAVTANLASALHHLRRREKPRPMWIDYLCINQRDLDEKNVQVALMGQIYRKANRVVAYLGDLTPQIERSITWTERYTQRKVNSRTLFWWKLDIKAWWSRDTEYNRDSATLDACLGKKDLIHLPYWTRMWTYQEYHLPRNDPICMCGNLVFKSTVITDKASNQLDDAQVAIIRKTRPRKEHDERARAQYEQANNLNPKPDSALYGMFTNHAGRNYIVRNRFSKIPNEPLGDLMARTASHSCHDPRDKIFALYGMAPAAQRAYPADYKKPVQQVLRETTEFIFNQEMGPAVFRLFPVRANNIHDESLPSWVPDFTREACRMPRQSQYSLLRPDETLTTPIDPHQSRVTNDLATLHLWARPVGRCKVLFQFSSDEREVASQIWQCFQSPDALGNNIWMPSDLPERFLRACLSHRWICYQFGIEEIADTLQQMVREWTDGVGGGGLIGECWAMLEEELRCNSSKTVFRVVNSDGTDGFGVSGVGVQDEDLVVVASGAHEPLVLRGKAGRTSHYQLVGQAVVDGVYEEQVPNPVSDEVQRRPFEEFLLI